MVPIIEESLARQNGHANEPSLVDSALHCRARPIVGDTASTMATVENKIHEQKHWQLVCRRIHVWSKRTCVIPYFFIIFGDLDKRALEIPIHETTHQSFLIVVVHRLGMHPMMF